MVSNTFQDFDGQILEARWNGVTIVISIAISYSGAMYAILLNEARGRTEIPHSKIYSATLLMTASLSISIRAIFFMHFVGMTAVTVYIPGTDQLVPVYFDIWYTVLSAVICAIAVLWGFYHASKDEHWNKIIHERTTLAERARARRIAKENRKIRMGERAATKSGGRSMIKIDVTSGRFSVTASPNGARQSNTELVTSKNIYKRQSDGGDTDKSFGQSQEVRPSQNETRFMEKDALLPTLEEDEVHGHNPQAGASKGSKLSVDYQPALGSKSNSREYLPLRGKSGEMPVFHSLRRPSKLSSASPQTRRRDSFSDLQAPPSIASQLNYSSPHRQSTSTENRDDESRGEPLRLGRPEMINDKLSVKLTSSYETDIQKSNPQRNLQVAKIVPNPSKINSTTSSISMPGNKSPVLETAASSLLNDSEFENYDLNDFMDEVSVLFERPTRIFVSGFFIALAVLAMHYLGMYSMRMEAIQLFNPVVVAISVVIALVAATAGMFIIFRVLPYFPYDFVKYAAAVIIAIAVNGMHYTGMAALQFQYQHRPDFNPEGLIQPVRLGEVILYCEVISFNGVALLNKLSNLLGHHQYFHGSSDTEQHDRRHPFASRKVSGCRN
ncbi:hypothetical protein BC830DRAFT_1234590 [Chytriomyces sp. MP71]|nr:hypothetical protein BC830DRAFT_1234590 [Chytriomyces sp. MP71]